MKCNVCGKEFGNGAYCQNCGSDIITARGNYTDGGYGVPSQTPHNRISDEPSKPLQSKKSDINKNVSLPQNSDNMNGSMICYNCAEVIPSDSIFCPCCGVRLFTECPKCGHKYSSRFKICNQCGTNYQEFINAQSEKAKEEDQKAILTRWLELTGSYSGTTILESKRHGISGQVIIPNGVTEIGYSAFEGCKGLTSIEIPDSVTNIDGGSFGSCSLESISVSRGNKSFKSKQNCCLSKNGKTLVFGCKSSIIPKGVTKIGDCAFEGCEGLTSIEIPDSVTEIGDFAFWGCEGLTSIEIPKGVTKIGDYAFESCEGLTSVEIPSNCSFDELSFGPITEIKRRK